MSDTPLDKACQSAGGRAALGRLLGITGPAVSQWKRVPANRVLAVEAATGVPRHELRPDLYPPPSEATPGITGASIALLAATSNADARGAAE